jgi:hypothetical protein
MSRGTLREDLEYSDYYKGFSELGETGVVEVDVSDASAHAWVEVYDPEYGWTVVEMTPPGGEEDTVDFWSNFQKAFSDGDVDTTPDNGTGGFNISINDSFMGKIIYFVFLLAGVFVIVVLVRLLIPRIKNNIAYRTAGPSDRLVMEYGRQMKKLTRRNKELKHYVNYRTKTEYLVKENFWNLTKEEEERYIDIMERAGFSKNEISREDYEFAHEITLRNIERQQKS